MRPFGFQCLFVPLCSLLKLSLSVGGDEEDRTPDPLLAKQVLSQLSYTPKVSGFTFSSFSFLAGT